MKIAWVTRSFLDYRIPVFGELDNLCGHQLYLLYGTVITPERVHRKAQNLLGSRAIGLGGEKCIGDGNIVYEQLANKTITIPLQLNLLKYIRCVRPDVIVCDGFFQWTFYAILYHILFRTPVIMCYERTKHTERHSQWYRTLYRRIAARFFAGICCNGLLSLEYVRDILKVPANKLSSGHMAADVESMAKAFEKCKDQRERLRKNFGDYEVIFLFVGRMIPLKGGDLLLEAFARFREKSPVKSCLVMLGDGPELEKYRAMHIPDVFLPGRYPYDKIAEMYSIADVFIIPTIEDNWSLVVPEAMACGLPVASSVYNGCYPELVTPENGWLFDPLKSGDLEQVLYRIVSDREKFAEFGKHSREIVFAHHTPRCAAQAIWNAIKNKKI